MATTDLYSIESPDAPPKERNWWVYVVLVLICSVNFIPYMYVVMTGFMDRAAATSATPTWIFKPTLEAFRYLIFEKGIMWNFFNSSVVALASTFFSVTIGMFCAYAIARYDFTGRDDVSFWVLTNRMMPPVAVLLPNAEALGYPRWPHLLVHRDAVAIRSVDADGLLPGHSQTL